MLDKNGFDLWADGYDKTVGISDEDDSYPFAGYKNVLAFIYRKILEHNSAVLLDIGFGTGTLTAKLYEQGCEIYGQDFSAKMLELAQAKMPEAHLYQGDFSKGLAEPLLQRHYDSILATYSLHHLTDDEKIRFLQLLKSLLKKGGYLFIGDVAFETEDELSKCRQEAAEEWDEEEFYFVADQLREAFPDLQFTKISHCAGVITLPA
nr:class I SAM-dependent methyltransferase [uncultured Acetatifactor sp.]